MTSPLPRLVTALADRYRIERELGQGGMATVYLAEDLKHDRKVALKVLKPELAAVIGAERFVVEIKTTAALQHPHILPLFDSGTVDGFLYYVMPFIDGETLRSKLDRETQLGIDESVAITVAVADALDYAHHQGVIHRDIKPENILLHNGRPMVADFGIALALSAAAGGRMTETGMSLGTPHYMSPEQATAEKEISARSDVYSLGSVLYEMLTGDPPHTGSSAQQIIMKIVTDTARPVTELRKSVPPNVAAAVAKSLEKLPADRFESAKAFAEALGNTSFTMLTAAAGRAAGVAANPRLVRALTAACVLLLAGALWGWLRPKPDASVARYGLSFPPGQELTDVYNMPFALAPDGSWMVYDGPAETGQQLWVKPRNSYEASPLTGTGHPGGGSAPSISPDGDWIVFTVNGQLRKVPRGGGSAITIADSAHQQFRTVAWLDDGTIVYRDRANRLRRVPDNGGVAEVVWAPDSGTDQRARLPTPLPGARGVFFSFCSDGGCSDQGGWVLDFKSGQARALVPDAVMTWYTPTGHLVYVRTDGGVFAAPFDLGSLEVTGPSVPILEGVKVVANLIPRLAMSASGMMLMIAGPAGGGIGVPAEAVWVTREGRATLVDSSWQFSLVANHAWALSPDGRRLAVTLRGPTDNDVWIKELDRGPISRLTVDKAEDVRPHWTADGQSISFITNRGTNTDVYLRRADGTLPAEVLVDLDEDIYEAVWSRDGTWLVLRIGGNDGERDIWAQQLGTDSAPTRLLATDFDENGVTLSPDGRWLAYQSDESGEDEIYVRPFPDISAGKWTVSLGGGSRPLWAHSGRELFYIHGGGNGRAMMAAQIRTSPTFEVTERLTLFPVPPSQYLLPPNYTPYDISPDDRRFLLMRRAGSGDEAPQTALILVENWFEELKAKMDR